MGANIIFYYFCTMKRFVINISLLVTSIILCRCANVVSPSGGPKDVTPPVVVETSPKNNTTNFKGKTIHITFDEYVTLNNASNNILISPPQNKKPSFRISGKTLIIKFEETLKPETTYSINFGEAIKDLHEGNVFNGYNFVFSTGDKMDSLSLKGKVTSASTLKPSANFFVELYSSDNDTITFDSLPYRVKPDYVTITDKDGNFHFSGLADKEYLIFTLKDSNSNMIFDLPNEEIGFYPDLVRPYFIENQFVIDTTKVLDSIQNDTIIQQKFVTDSISNDSIAGVKTVADIKKTKYPSYELFSFVQEDSIQKIFKKELVEDGLLRFVFRYPATNVSITAVEELPDTFNIMQVYSARKDTVLWYFTPNKDSLWISINHDTIICDTTRYSLKPRETMSKKRRQQTDEKKKILAVNSNLKGNKLKPKQPLTLIFNEPITHLNIHDTTWFIVDKDTIINDLQFNKIDENGFRFQIDKHFEPEKKYQIIIPDSIFFGFRGLTNDTLRYSFTISEESQFGNIFLTVEVPENVPQIIIELTDEKDKVIDKQIITETQEISFEYLNPAKYKLKATLDLDANGVWSPGNFSRKIQPEKIIFYKGTLEVRANWDIDLDEPWIIENYLK